MIIQLYILNNLHADYIRQCGSWTGLEVSTIYEFTEQQQNNIWQYNAYQIITQDQKEAVFCLKIITAPAIWCLFWTLLGFAVRSVVQGQARLVRVRHSISCLYSYNVNLINHIYKTYLHNIITDNDYKIEAEYSIQLTLIVRENKNITVEILQTPPWLFNFYQGIFLIQSS